jgi:ubiquinone/menaquinone biosynthesis C-methylase UbiE
LPIIDACNILGRQISKLVNGAFVKSAAQLAQDHWNETPLWLSEQERYSTYPWLYAAAEFEDHRDHRVLEVGCGTGCDLLQFAKHGAIATGVDITREHLQLAKRRVGNAARVEFADARQLPFPAETFDYVYSHGVLHHSDDPSAIANEIMRVLKPGGRFNVHVYAKWSYVTPYVLLRYGRHWKLHIENSTAPVHIDLYTARMMRRLFRVSMEFSKYEFKTLPALQPFLGWFLVAKGSKPQ